MGHINRNVKVVAGPDSGWGYSVTVYGYRDTNDNLWVGSVDMTGVQIEGGGQMDSVNAPLKFLNVKGGTRSNVQKVSFIGCRANCIYI